MKTPMQQMIDQLEVRRQSAEYGKEHATIHAEFCAYESVMIELEQCITLAEKLLEVERKEYVNFGNYARHPVNAMITVDGLFSKTFKND